MGLDVWLVGARNPIRSSTSERDGGSVSRERRELRSSRVEREERTDRASDARLPSRRNQDSIDGLDGTSKTACEHLEGPEGITLGKTDLRVLVPSLSLASAEPLRDFDGHLTQEVLLEQILRYVERASDSHFSQNCERGGPYPIRRLRWNRDGQPAKRRGEGRRWTPSLGRWDQGTS